MKILLTGASGRLGKELLKLGRFYAPTHKELDITKPIKTRRNFDLIIHCAGYTNVALAEKERDKCYKVNVQGTINLLETFPLTPFVFISSEYAYKPTNYYAVTKALGEREVMLRCINWFIIRTLFKEYPYPYNRAFTDQWTQGDFVDIIAPLIYKEILGWFDRMYRSDKLVYVGTGRKTVYDLLKKRYSDIKPASVDEVTWVELPRDYL